MRILKLVSLALLLLVGNMTVDAQRPGGGHRPGGKAPRGGMPPHMKQQQNNLRANRQQLVLPK